MAHASRDPLQDGLAYVLDDEPQVGMLVCRVLGACGFTPRQFTNPAPFMAEVKAMPPELIALDLALGQSDAIEIIRLLELLKYKGKIVLISGRDETTLAEVTQIGERHGLAMLPPLKKPFRVADLEQRLSPSPASPQSTSGDSLDRAAPARKATVQLSDALANRWLELWYQPKVDLKSLAVCGAEALLRARHPEHGIVEPLELLPPAGDPAFQSLSKFVIERAIADWTMFADNGIALKLAVNMPVSVVHAPDFIRLARRYLPKDSRFPGLIVEVSEDEVIRDPDWVREVATQLKLYNISISIDDVGSAYASLSTLQDLPFDEVKIDSNVVADCASNALKQGLCRTVVELGHRFGATVCAEGVEKAEDLRALVAMGCDTAQGFLFAKPMSADHFVSMMVKRSQASMHAQVGQPADHDPHLTQSA